MKKQIIFLLFIFVSVFSYSQVHGFVRDNEGQVIPGVHVRWLGTDAGTVSDDSGHFRISPSVDTDLLIFSSVGYASDTVNVSGMKAEDHQNIILNDNTELSELTVLQRRNGRNVNRLVIQNLETLNTNELRKAACCNLSESFTTNPSVDVSYSDAATGAKQIKLLGLSGGYVQMLTENIPNLRGLSSAYGMGYIPGPWMESIQISKGTASAKTGYEAIAGQINVEYKKPQNSDKVSLNLFTNSMGRVEWNADAAVRLKDSLSSSVLLHASDEYMMLDDNKDGYMDLPRVRQYNLANRWFYQKNNYILQTFVRGLSEKRTGGRTDNSYNIGINTERYELFVKNGFLFGENDHGEEGEHQHEHDNDHHFSSLGIIVNGTIHNQDAAYGTKKYTGHQYNLYLNVIYDKELGEHHKLSTGTSFNMDTYDEILKVVNQNEFRRTEYVPGVFAEYTMTYRDITAMAGLRADYNSVYGMFISPRFHLRYNIQNQVHLRLSAGKGYRTPNVLAENNYFLASNRELNIADNLKQEEAWNFGATVHFFIPVWDGKELGLMGEWFYTNFINQVVADVDSNPHAASFYNLNGKSYSGSVQFEANLEVFRGLTATLAHRINDVKTTIGGELREKPLNNRSKSLVTLSYLTPLKKWQFDYTAQFNGGGRMPDPDADNPLWEREFKPFAIMNAQFTRNFRTWSVYAGAENMTNFVQKNPVIDVQNPFGNNFDASMVWGPMHGRTLYAGIRWALAKEK